MSKKLAQTLSLPLVLHNISAPRLRGLKQNDPRVHKSDNVPPEVALISIAIVVIRLVYGLDGRTRYACFDEPPLLIVLPVPRVPFQFCDPAYAFPKLGEYIGLLKRLNAEDESSIDNVLSSFTEMHVIPLFSVQNFAYH